MSLKSRLDRHQCVILRAFFLKIAAFLQKIPVDGLWIDMNEPTNFCNGECKLGIMETTKVFIDKSLLANVHQSLIDPPYNINNQNNKLALNVKTLDPGAVQHDGTTHYSAHNLYGKSTSFNLELDALVHVTSTLFLHVIEGLTEAIATRTALESIRQNVRSFIISRSTFSGSGVHTGHWTGDNRAAVSYTHLTLPTIYSV